MTDAAFDLLGELPRGTTVLEASAGTGKTFTIAGLVTRYVAEGVVPLGELLVVTFGRAATQELRDRVRERLVTARDGLRDAPAARAGDDHLLRHLATGSDTEVDERRRRLVEALASFDAATVVTTHQFCQQMLIGLGTAGDVDTHSVLVENLDDLVTEVVHDLYLRKWGHGDVLDPPMDLKTAQELARTVVADVQAMLVPDVDDDSLAGLRLRFARAVRAEVDRRKRARRVLGFDDLLTRLQQTLADPQTGPAAVTRLRGRYRVVLVDEFQDTDPVQWDVLRRAFHGAATLVLVGDPKQAIYAFRGADVQAYLVAAELADHRATLAQNWRSDPDLLRGLDALFRGAALGDPRIVVGPVSAAQAGRSLESAEAPVRVRLVRREGGGEPPGVDTARRLVVRDVVREVVGLLNGQTILRPRDNAPERPLRPADIAVIVRTNTQLDLVHDALLAARVPSVRRTTSSVFRASAAGDWIVLLEALEQPHRSGRLRRLAVSPFVGWDAAALDGNDVDELGLRLRHWLRVYEQRGVAALLETITRDERLPSRLLAQVDGERRLTDLRHVGEALHAASMSGQLGLTAGLVWLRHRVEEAEEDSSVERGRRLDSEAAAVQVVTVHASKGLEFPIVLAPFGWDRHVFDPDIPLFHEPTGRRVRNVGGRSSPSFRRDQSRHRDEEFGEDLRLLYVTLTRAQSQAVAWWAPSTKNTTCAPLHRLLFTDSPASGVPDRRPVPNDSTALARASKLAVDGCLSVSAVAPAGEVSWERPPAVPTPLSAATLDRRLDTSWRRTSYSALTAAAHDVAPAVASEPELDQKDDEPVTATPAAAPGELHDVISPMEALPGGTGFGTIVHAVLEHLDPTSADLAGAVGEQVAAQLSWSGPAGVDQEGLTAALLPALRTPLGEIAGGRSLADIAPGDRLAELGFELPLRGGDHPNGTSRLGELADLLRERLRPDDPLAGYADMLTEPVLSEVVLKGYLAGSIDAVLRVDGRYLIVDYKTNRLGTPDAPLTAWDYRGTAMAEAMIQAHYPLQALLYDVAVHRFLRWRLADYDPARHLGGVLYLFLRGMCGPDIRFADGTIPGVFCWRPPPTLVMAASDLLAGVRR